MAKMYAVRESPGRGRGVFATNSIAAGTNIMRDKVALRIEKAGPAVQTADVIKAFNSLNEPDQKRFLALHEGTRRYDDKRFRIWKANVFGGDASTSPYFNISLINHACVPNAMFTSESDHAEVVALKPISKGEEVLISYNSLFNNLIKRHRANALRLYYGFECSCSACSLPPDQQALSDGRRQLLNVLTNALEGYQAIDTSFFEMFGTLTREQAEHPAVLNGISRLPLASPLSLDMKHAYRLLAAGLQVAEGHSTLELANAYSGVAEALLRYMQVLDDVISLRSVSAVETWMQSALKLVEELCGSGSETFRTSQELWKDMMDTDQMRAGMIFLRNYPAMKKKTFAIKLGEIDNGGLHLSELSEPEYRLAVRQKLG